jgi:plastocyanin
MKKGLIAFIVAIIAIGGITAIVVTNKKSESKTNSSDTGPATTQPVDSAENTTQDTDTPAVAGSEVAIEGFAFTPANLTVKKGTTVTWTNKDSAPHTVTGEDGGPDSATLQPNDTYQFTFSEVGSFAYHCNFHTSMVAKVTVTE